MTYADTPLDRVETFIEVLEHHGHGKSIVSCQYDHEAHWPGENRDHCHR